MLDIIDLNNRYKSLEESYKDKEDTNHTLSSEQLVILKNGKQTIFALMGLVYRLANEDILKDQILNDPHYAEAIPFEFGSILSNYKEDDLEYKLGQIIYTLINIVTELYQKAYDDGKVTSVSNFMKTDGRYYSDIHILLTMIKVNEDDIKPWFQISYEELAKRMDQEFRYQYFDNYFADFLRDYIKYIYRLSEDVREIGIDLQRSIKDWLKEKNDFPNESEWERQYLQKARFQMLANEISQKYHKPLICVAGIVRGYTPFIDIWPIAFSDSDKSNAALIKEWRKSNREKHQNKYWCQIYEDHVERGFQVFYDTLNIDSIFEKAKENKRLRKAEKKFPFYEKIWNACLEIPELKEIAEMLDLEEKFDQSIEKNGAKALMGYIYSDYVMVYVRTDIPDESIEKFAGNISEELNKVYEIITKNQKK